MIPNSNDIFSLGVHHEFLGLLEFCYSLSLQENAINFYGRSRGMWKVWDLVLFM